MDEILDRFAKTLDPLDTDTLQDLHDYVQWCGGRDACLDPSTSDDVSLRTYLLKLRIDGLGADQTTLLRIINSLKRFHEWAQAEALIDSNPFAEYNLERVISSQDQVRRRIDVKADSLQERELVRLQALNRLVEELNRSADMQTALDAALETVVTVMELRTAWISLRSDANLRSGTASDAPPHGFVLSAAIGLPPALEQDDRYLLRRPPECHCQSLLRSGHLTRAVNVVECTRLQSATSAGGDTRGLLFHATVPIISGGRSLGILNVATEDWQVLTASDLHLLSAIGGQIAIALERARLYDLSQAQLAYLERELEMARAVQASLFPDHLPEIPGFGLAAYWSSAREVAGDFYNIFPLPNGRWGLVIADVADKGAGAAMYMAIAYTMIRAKAEQTPSPAEALTQVNQALISTSSAETFVTVLYAILDPVARTLTYANAGHNPPIVRRASEESQPLVLPNGGLVLGVFDDVKLRDETLHLGSGDAVVLYTDGVTEGENLQGDEYGLTRLVTAIASGPAGASALQAHILADHSAFASSERQADDLTLFVVTCES